MPNRSTAVPVPTLMMATPTTDGDRVPLTTLSPTIQITDSGSGRVPLPLFSRSAPPGRATELIVVFEAAPVESHVCGTSSPSGARSPSPFFTPASSDISSYAQGFHSTFGSLPASPTKSRHVTSLLGVYRHTFGSPTHVHWQSDADVHWQPTQTLTGSPTRSMGTTVTLSYRGPGSASLLGDSHSNYTDSSASEHSDTYTSSCGSPSRSGTRTSLARAWEEGQAWPELPQVPGIVIHHLKWLFKRGLPEFRKSYATFLYPDGAYDHLDYMFWINCARFGPATSDLDLQTCCCHPCLRRRVQGAGSVDPAAAWRHRSLSVISITSTEVGSEKNAVVEEAEYIGIEFADMYLEPVRIILKTYAFQNFEDFGPAAFGYGLRVSNHH
ncbi:hypothetical protein B0H11DRAFT_2182875 [Mycena galericulata]|nr:hypothetical protein B0H11DRAFT_2182875 [Mycena galericulata]